MRAGAERSKPQAHRGVQTCEKNPRTKGGAIRFRGNRTPRNSRARAARKRGALAGNPCFQRATPRDNPRRVTPFAPRLAGPRCVFALALTLTTIAPLRAADPAIRSLPVGPNPESVVRGFDGKLCVTLMGEQRSRGAGDGRVAIIDGDHVSTLAAGFDDPKGLVFLDGVLVTADFDRVWSIAADGAKKLIAGPEAFPTPPLYLNDVVVAPGGHAVLVTEMGANTKMFSAPGKLWPLDSAEAQAIPALGRVYRVTMNGEVSVVIDHTPLLQNPNGVDALDDGTIRVAEFFFGRLLEWRAGAWRTIGDDYRSADGIVHDRAGNIYATEVFTGRVWRVNAASGERTLLATLQSAADLILDDAHHQLVVPDSRAGALAFIPLP